MSAFSCRRSSAWPRMRTHKRSSRPRSWSSAILWRCAARRSRPPPPPPARWFGGGAPADLAARFRLPVLLVLDVSRQSQSAAAVVRGFAAHDPAVRIVGVVMNRVGSDRHRMLVTDAIAALDIPVVGAVPRDQTL